VIINRPVADVRNNLTYTMASLGYTPIMEGPNSTIYEGQMDPNTRVLYTVLMGRLLESLRVVEQRRAAAIAQCAKENSMLLYYRYDAL
jgi:hypothetical protein